MATNELERMVVPYFEEAELEYEDRGYRLNTVINYHGGIQLLLTVLDHELSDIGRFELQICFGIGGKFTDDETLKVDVCKRLTQRFAGRFDTDIVEGIGLVMIQTVDWFHSVSNDSDDFKRLFRHLIGPQISLICPAMMLVAWSELSTDDALASIYNQLRQLRDRSNLVNDVNGIFVEDGEDEASKES